MWNKRLLHIETETTKDQRPRVACGRALVVEIHLLADEVVQAPNFRPDEDVQFRRKQIQHVGKPVAAQIKQ